MSHQFIPEISDERIAEMLEKITPLVRKTEVIHTEDGGLHFPYDKRLHRIKLPDNLRKTSFTWGPEFLEEVDESKLVRLQMVRTYHTCGYHGVCKPSIPEVLAQIPETWLPAVTAFEVCMDDGIVEFVDRQGFYGHGFVTILYRERDKD